MDYLSADRVELRYSLPLAEIVFDFLSTRSSPYRGLRFAWTTEINGSRPQTW